MGQIHTISCGWLLVSNDNTQRSGQSVDLPMDLPRLRLPIKLSTLTTVSLSEIDKMNNIIIIYVG